MHRASPAILSLLLASIIHSGVATRDNTDIDHEEGNQATPNDFFAILDADNSGQISYKEFNHFFQGLENFVPDRLFQQILCMWNNADMGTSNTMTRGYFVETWWKQTTECGDVTGTNGDWVAPFWMAYDMIVNPNLKDKLPNPVAFTDIKSFLHGHGKILEGSLQILMDAWGDERLGKNKTSDTLAQDRVPLFQTILGEITQEKLTKKDKVPAPITTGNVAKMKGIFDTQEKLTQEKKDKSPAPITTGNVAKMKEIFEHPH